VAELHETPTAPRPWPGLHRGAPLARLAVSVFAGALVVVALLRFHWMVRLVAGWNALAATELVLTFWLIASSGPAETKARARTDEPGRGPTLLLLRVMTPACLFLSIYLLRRAGDAPAELRGALVALCLAAIVSSWLLTHTAYAAHYARLYYRCGGGLAFPGDAVPDTWDFLYFAFTVGMCFQVSDVTITGRALRRAALKHAVVSFAYNTAILAVALNLVVSL
jgi:uncharacterized membrane protein